MSGNHPEIVIISTSDGALIAEEMTKAGVTHCLTEPALPSDIYNKLMELTNRNWVDTITPNERPDQQADLSDRTVLLVEDVELNRLIVEELLSETGIHIEHAENGQLALSKFLAHPERYDLILMDLQMPVMDGISATKAIREAKVARSRDIPIYAMTAHTYKEDIDSCLDAGMNGHIAKPIDLTVLLKTLDDVFSAG